MLKTWTVNKMHNGEHYAAIVTADDVEQAKYELRQKLPDLPVSNTDLVPCPTHSRYARVLHSPPVEVDRIYTLIGGFPEPRENPGPWRTERPPNEELVEVELDGKIIRVKAFYGRDGWRPHWRSEDGVLMWSVDTFKRWRAIENDAIA